MQKKKIFFPLFTKTNTAMHTKIGSCIQFLYIFYANRQAVKSYQTSVAKEEGSDGYIFLGGLGIDWEELGKNRFFFFFSEDQLGENSSLTKDGSLICFHHSDLDRSVSPK